VDDDSQETSRGTLPVRRHARWYEIGGAGQARWIVLHGYAQRAERFLRRFRAIAGPERQIVAPEGLSRFYTDDRYQRVGASWMTRDDRELEITDTLDWLDALIAHLDARDGAPARTTVLGFSQGAHTAGRWAALRGARIDRLICWGSGLPQDVDLDRFATAPYDLEFVVGTEDPLVPAPALAREFERVREAGIAFGITEFEGGHTIDPATLQRLVSS
jgi:predicted esterase